ncbi:TPA: hypothetical protein DEP94_03330 [Candidatus Nomurabacteria bacterium]|nr:hypothetical protein [Candidatus Nomurabacteria bacterium]
MKKIMNVGTYSALALLVSVGLASQVYAYNQITATLDQGQTNGNVTNLQTFFADNSAIYPEGLITGYFGGLTGAAVRRFQSTYNLVSSGTPGTTGYGRVGPMTKEKINDLIATGGWTTADISGPAFYNVVKNQSSNSATFTFNTSENTIARVVYNTSPLMFNEGDMNSNGFGAIGGSSVNSFSNMGTAHTVTIPNLLANTVYYYTIIATDSTGNVSVVGPNNSFRTN